MKLPNVPVKTDYVRLKGGLDLETPALSMDPGSLIAGMNYMAGTEGGYYRIDGYERYSGKTSPSDGTYYYAAYTLTAGGPEVGDTITGDDSGSTGQVITVGTGYINYTLQSAAFNDDEVFTVAAVAKGTFTAGQVEKGETTPLLHVTALNATADVYRALIAKPTGSGAVRGVVMLAGVLYCFVDNAGGTAGLIYKATASGWSAVTPGNEISFNTGTGLIAEGDTVEGGTSGATAVVARVVLESGTWGTDAAGRLIIGTVTSGPFEAENLEVTGVEAVATGAESAITISDGGHYEFVVHNFTGSTATKRIYGCNGVDRGFEFDGTVYVPIDTGMTVDVPEHISAYQYQLFFSFKGSNQNSAIGFPYVWSAVLGASEIALGDDIVGYSAEAQGLIICSRNSTHQLLGDSAATFFLDIISDEAGAIPYTIQSVGKAYALDDRGIVEFSRVQEYGNFDMATISRKAQARINDIRAVAVASSVYRTRNQYRIYGTDGTGICVTIGIGQQGPRYYFSQFSYPDNVACAWSGEDANGKDSVFFGDDAGMVYQADKGSSFDGANIEAYAFLPYNHSKSPSMLKTYRYATFEMTVEKYAAIQFNAMFSYGNSEIQPHLVSEFEIQGDAGLWDVDAWGEFFLDSDIVSAPHFTLEGEGTNMSLSIYSDSDIDLGHKIDGLIIHYTPRRIIR